MTYAQQVHLDGTPLAADDFKTNPEGHTGGALNMVPAYAGYLALNALTGRTRAWLMGQGHCVAAVDALNLADRQSAPRAGAGLCWRRSGHQPSPTAHREAETAKAHRG